MGRVVAARIESGVDAGASAVFAAAVGYALHGLIAASAGVTGGGILAFTLCFAGLRKVVPESRFPDVSKSLVDAAPSTPIGALLSEADRIISEKQPAAGDELVLDDILAEIGPQSRVVRLFDPDTMPTPGQLQARIDRHVGAGRLPDGSRDASQDLLSALAELRRSLN